LSAAGHICEFRGSWVPVSDTGVADRVLGIIEIARAMGRRKWLTGRQCKPLSPGRRDPEDHPGTAETIPTGELSQLSMGRLSKAECAFPQHGVRRSAAASIWTIAVVTATTSSPTLRRGPSPISARAPLSFPGGDASQFLNSFFLYQTVYTK
jgi:hypothetical protein